MRLSVILYEAFHHYIVFHCANIPQLIYSIVNRQWLFIVRAITIVLLETFLLTPTDNIHTLFCRAHTHPGKGLLGTFSFKR